MKKKYSQYWAVRLSDFGLNTIERHLISKRMTEPKKATFLGSAWILLSIVQCHISLQK